MRRDDFDRWVQKYRHAWESNRGDDIAALFADDAEYLTEPFAEPWRGRDEIVLRWLERKDEPGSATSSFEVLAADGDLGVVQGATDYVDPPKRYSNLWLIRLAPDGRATLFVEYWMKRPPKA